MCFCKILSETFILYDIFVLELSMALKNIQYVCNKSQHCNEGQGHLVYYVCINLPSAFTGNFDCVCANRYWLLSVCNRKF